MKHETFVFRSRFPFPAETVFSWHERPGAFERLTPPWERVQIVSRTGGIRDGGRVSLRVKIGPFRRIWIVEHRDYIQGRQFCDVQTAGPFRYWKHIHRVEPEGSGACVLEDHIEYSPPCGELGTFLGGRIIQNKLTRMFAYRHSVTLADLKAHERFQDRAKKKILLSGATGLIGSGASAFLETGGHCVTRLVRRQDQLTGNAVLLPAPTEPEELSGLEGFDAVVHLAGENITGRWTDAKKQKIRDSRVLGTGRLCQALAKLDSPPRTLVCASAIGFYGDRSDEILDEKSRRGEGFLAEVCQQWEQAADAAAQAGVRVVNLRISVVLTSAGGALAQMLTPFRMGFGGRIGDGKQYMSWISYDDVLSAIQHALETDDLEGPVNAASPNPVTNDVFTRILGEALHRPAAIPAPAFAIRSLLGEMGEALLLSSARVMPRRLMDAGFTFRHANLQDALNHVLGIKRGDES
ncbi:MAG: TIGR01777 family oxidoreductase [Candidatus Omnitrophica bacterium]|nr:TIGR01777 family oxidoreductase [Candidatus Omnitrophota bacterium]